MSDEQQMPASFPLAGVNVACEFSRQPTDTTPVAANVRGFDTLVDRARGGSRPGLTKWIDEQVFGDSVIQHLTTLVDPTLPALTAEVDSVDDTVPDPTTGPRNTWGRRVRRRGSGRQPSRNKPGAANTGIRVLQKKTVNIFFTQPYEVTFDEPVLAGSNVVVVVVTEIGTASNPANDPTGAVTVGGVRNGDSAEFAQIGGGGYGPECSYKAFTFGDRVGFLHMSGWYRRATGLAADRTVRVEGLPSPLIATNVSLQVSITEYAGMEPAPLHVVRVAASVASDTFDLPPLLTSNIPGQAAMYALFGYQTPDGTPGAVSLTPPPADFVDDKAFKRRILQAAELDISGPLASPSHYVAIGVVWSKS